MVQYADILLQRTGFQLKGNATEAGVRRRVYRTRDMICLVNLLDFDKPNLFCALCAMAWANWQNPKHLKIIKDKVDKLSEHFLVIFSKKVNRR